MSTSPPNYDFEGDPLLEAYMNAKFSEEISEKMKVPKRSKSFKVTYYFSPYSGHLQP
jgi:hypothetical protein